MVKLSQSFHCLFLLLALISVNMIVSEVPVVKAATCFKVLTDVIRTDGKVETVCLPTCRKQCGSSAGATCIDQVGFPGPVCSWPISTCLQSPILEYGDKSVSAP